jgi:hypothetical protein
VIQQNVQHVKTTGIIILLVKRKDVLMKDENVIQILMVKI